jgi:hypothetical protein
MGIVNFRKGCYISKVQVKSCSIDVAFSTSVVKDRNWIFWMIAIVIEDDNLGIDPECRERGT